MPADDPKSHEGGAQVHAESRIAVGDSLSLEVGQGLNDVRLSVVGILVTIGLTVGFGVSGPWWCAVPLGAASSSIAWTLIW